MSFRISLLWNSTGKSKVRETDVKWSDNHDSTTIFAIIWSVAIFKEHFPRKLLRTSQSLTRAALSIWQVCYRRPTSNMKLGKFLQRPNSGPRITFDHYDIRELHLLRSAFWTVYITTLRKFQQVQHKFSINKTDITVQAQYHKEMHCVQNAGSTPNKFSKWEWTSTLLAEDHSRRSKNELVHVRYAKDKRGLHRKQALWYRWNSIIIRLSLLFNLFSRFFWTVEQSTFSWCCHGQQ